MVICQAEIAIKHQKFAELPQLSEKPSALTVCRQTSAAISAVLPKKLRTCGVPLWLASRRGYRNSSVFCIFCLEIASQVLQSSVRVAASVARRREGSGEFLPQSGTRGANFIPPVARKGGRG